MPAAKAAPSGAREARPVVGARPGAALAAAMAAAAAPEAGAPAVPPPPPPEKAPEAPAPAAAPAPPAPAAPAPAPEAKAEAPAAPPAASPPAPAPAPAPEPPPPPKRAAGNVKPVVLFHKTAQEAMRYFQREFPDYIENGHVDTVDGARNTLLAFGDDNKIKEIESRLQQFDNLELDLVVKLHKLRYIDVGAAMEALAMAGVSNVWVRVQEMRKQEWKEGKYTRVFEHPTFVWAKVGPGTGEVAPASIASDFPYCFELPQVDSFEFPEIDTGRGASDQKAINFARDPSTEDRNVIVVVGTDADHERIRATLDLIDKPARQVMIECQIIEMTAADYRDYGLDSIETGQRHSILQFAGPLGGENIMGFQPGFANALRRTGPNATDFPDVVNDGLSYIFDDSSVDLAGRFIFNLHAAVRQGDATIKARPKLLTLDGRRNILHVGQEVPVFDEQAVTTDVTGGNFAQQIRRVSRQYVGITLNMEPRIVGEDNKEVSLNLEIVMNELGNRVFVDSADLMGVPTVVTRRFLGQARVQNHRPIILGGLINEEESQSTNKIPIIGDIPYLGTLLSRTVKSKDRTELIVIITPHILSEKGPDRIATPKDSPVFDTLDSVLYNDRYIVKPSDPLGVDPITKRPLRTGQDVFSEMDCVDLTLLNIVRKLELVRKLEILGNHLPNEAQSIGWFQRLHPDRNAKYWDDEQRKVYYKAAAIVIENIKELNTDLNFDDLVAKPKRELVLPSSPGRVAISFDQLKLFYEKGYLALRGTEKVSQEAIDQLVSAEGYTLKDFASYVRERGRTEEDHEDLRAELTSLYRALHSDGADLSGLEYPDFLVELDRNGINFATIATYFRENLTGRYARTGTPAIGSFVADVKTMAETSITIDDRAQRLYELERRWDQCTGPAYGSGE
ncbi:MAG: type II secretion system protein GspD [Planctomycetes bacterium]|nr:type II secretion system protein GspD [Planctomycetota bacterium]